jgi:hypothetical protein
MPVNMVGVSEAEYDNAFHTISTVVGNSVLIKVAKYINKFLYILPTTWGDCYTRQTLFPLLIMKLFSPLLQSETYFENYFVI